jgi:hypothetical protein
MTREEFGIELFEAVKCCGGLLAIQDQLQRVKPEKAADLEARQQALYTHLAALTVHLSGEDQRALCDRYPQLFGAR